MNYTTITSSKKYANATVTVLERNTELPCFVKEAKIALIVTNYNSAAIHLEDGKNNEIASFYFDKDVLISILKEDVLSDIPKEDILKGEDNETA